MVVLMLTSNSYEIAKWGAKENRKCKFHYKNIPHVMWINKLDVIKQKAKQRSKKQSIETCHAKHPKELHTQRGEKRERQREYARCINSEVSMPSTSCNPPAH